MPKGSKIFSGYRALGYNTNHVPLAVRYHRKHQDNYIVTCVGNAFHTYNCSKLGITSVSNSHPGDIECLAVDAYLVYTGCGKVVRAFERGRQVRHTYEGHDSDVHILLPFGAHLISVDIDSCVKVWDIKSGEVYFDLSFSNKSFQVTCMCHPSTYVNKVLFASQQGTLQLWNIKSGKQLYCFKGFNVPVTVLEQSPAVDVLGVGLGDGRIVLHNIRYDETVMTFTQDWGPVTAISFRTDAKPVLVTGSTVGHIALWDLEERRLLSEVRCAHNSTVSGLKCLPSQPIMVTSSADNSLKVWIFDQPDGGARLLRQRSGHSAPPNTVRFHDTAGQHVLSAGQDSTLRSFSTVHDSHNRSLGRASFNKAETKRSGLKDDQHMMPPITNFTSEASRESDWDGVVACHRGLSEVTTWSCQRHTMGQHRLRHDRFKSEQYINVVAQVVDISGCGNFTVIGYSSGHVDQYNLQSGIYRGSYGNPTAHKDTVRGVAIDGLNQQTITASADCTVKFWRFKQKTLLHTLQLDTPIAQMILHRESSMLAVALDDFRVWVVDVDTQRQVRQYDGHTNTITDMTFSPDARWLVTASMDATLRTWDLPTGQLIDCSLVEQAVTSVSMSPAGDFLATSHLDELGVYLWTNMTLYTHVALTPLPHNYEPTLLDLPTTSRRRRDGTEDDNEEQSGEDEEPVEFKSPEQISTELTTLSTLPNSRWQNLLSLDIIKARNKPKQPPKVPKAAPFFLPTVAGLEPKFDLTKHQEEQEKNSSKAVLGSLMPMSEFGRLLLTASKDKSYDNVLPAMKELSASGVDVELRLLAPEGGGSTLMMLHFLHFIQHVFTTNKDFELAQAWLALFIKLHGSMMAEEADLLDALDDLSQQQQQAWGHLQHLLNQNICLVNYLKSATL